MTSTTTSHRWRARPVLAGTLRCALLGVPVVASTGTVYALSRMLPPGTARTWWGLLALLTAAVVVGVVVERGARRLLPIALLLKLSMIFPDRAPSRLRLARAAASRTPKDHLLWHGTQARPTSTSELVLHLVSALGSHDRRTRGHSERVRLLTDAFAEELKLDQDARDRLRWSALLHDVGKMHVSSFILNKPSGLDEREFATMRQHPAAGALLVAPLMPWLGEWGEGILDHHEKYDGSGYPAGKAGEEISLAGRLIGLVDAFETMTAARPYKKAVATKTAREELARCAGTHFDPLLVRAFLAISLPRVLWAMGPVSFLLQLPFLRPVAYAGSRGTAMAPQTASALATSAAGATAGAVGAAVLVTGGIAGPVAGNDLPDRSPAASSQQQLPPPAATAPNPPPAAPPVAEPTPAQAQAPAEVVETAPAAQPEPVASVNPVESSDEDADPTPPLPEPVAVPAAQPAPTDLPGDEPPAEEPPAEEPPTEEPPAEEEPSEEPQPEESPTEPPQESPPAEEQPAPEQPAPEQPPPEQPPAEQPPAEQPPAEQPPAEQPPAEQPPAEQPPAEQPPAQGDTSQANGAIISGPPASTSSREAVFELAEVAGQQWECQILRNGSGESSAWQPCAGTWTITLVKDGEHAFRVRDAATGDPAGSWTWTVTSSTVSAQGLGDPQVLAAPHLALDELASPRANDAPRTLPLLAMAVATAAVAPITAAVRRRRARRV